MTCYNFVQTYNCIQLDISGGLSPLIKFLISGDLFTLITLHIRVKLVSVLFVPHIETYKLERTKTRILSSCSLFCKYKTPIDTIIKNYGYVTNLVVIYINCMCGYLVKFKHCGELVKCIFFFYSVTINYLGSKLKGNQCGYQVIFNWCG